jgi:hypothetical protein
MQEEVTNKAVNLVISVARLTAGEVKKAMGAYLDSLDKAMKEKMNAKPTGKQTVKQLVGQNQGVTNIEIAEKNIKSFDRVARKYGVDYAVKKDASGEVPKYLIFFKARDRDALKAAFAEYSGRKAKDKEKPSVIKHSRELKKPVIAKAVKKAHGKDMGLEL